MTKNNTVPRSTCGSGGCQSCPFSWTEEAEYASNTGCLPTQKEILDLPKEHNVVWGCHSDFDVICGGFAKTYKDKGNELDATLPIVDFTEYTNLGLDTAIVLAKVRKGINPIEEKIEKFAKNNPNINREIKHDLFDYSKVKVSHKEVLS